MTKRNINILKASGDTEVFDINKLKHSLGKAGADKGIIINIANDISDWLYEGVTTKKIYSRAFRLLRIENRIHAMRYRLKKTLYEMGPTGYPFEIFIGEIFKKRGYRTKVGVLIDGHCIRHEIDVEATNEKKQIFIECKYAMDQGKHVGVQVPLYVNSRVDDIRKKRKKMPEYKGFSFSACIATNTRFSNDSIEFSKCNQLDLIAWDYPSGKGLKDIMEKERVFPISILSDLNSKEKTALMNFGIVSCNQLISNIKVLNDFKIDEKKQAKIKRELEQIHNYLIED